MSQQRRKGALARLLGQAAQAGFLRAYEQIRIDERRYLRQVRRAHRLPIETWSDMFLLGYHRLAGVALALYATTPRSLPTEAVSVAV